MLSERKIYYWIPLLVEVCALYNSILIRYGIRYAYLFFLILGLSLLFRRKVLCKSKIYFFSIVIYIVSVILSSILFFFIFIFPFFLCVFSESNHIHNYGDDYLYIAITILVAI
jgi:hypothetical protein